MRRIIIAGNWKMNNTYRQAEELVNSIVAGMKDKQTPEVVVFPPSTCVRELSGVCKNSKIDLGIQNMYFEKEGAFTGEISPLMVKDSGCRYVLIGHSERRNVFGETDEMVNRKVRSALDNDIEPMVCVGELLEQRESGSTGKVIEKQIVSAFQGIDKGDMKKIVVAYEPVWAIGTGKVATPEIAEEVHSHIRSLLGKLYGAEIAEIVPILYGGSVKPDNISGLISMDNIDGALVGGASLKADTFLGIILY